jgi:hypothetical protein
MKNQVGSFLGHFALLIFFDAANIENVVAPAIVWK